MTETRDIAYYRRLPYRRIVELVEEDESKGYFVAMVEDLPWIRIHGETREEALRRLDDIFDDCVQSMLDDEGEIPEPLAWPADVGYVPEERSVKAAASTENSVTFTAADEADPWTMLDVEDEERRLAIA